MRDRRSPRALDDEGRTALRRAVASLPGVEVRDGAVRGHDLAVELGGGRRLLLEVKTTAHADPARIGALLPEWSAELRRSPKVVGVLVGDSIPARTRELLREAGWGWLDRRGHLFLQAPGVLVDTSAVAEVHPRQARHDQPIRGRAGMAVAAALLAAPDEPPGVRPLSRRLALAASTVSEALAALRAAALVDRDGRPVVPELFWELAGAWRPDAVPVASLPDDRSLLHLAFDRTDTPGWAIGGTLAAAMWGAPVSITAEYPVDFYVPDDIEHGMAVRVLGEATVWEQRAATVAVAPVEAVTAERHQQPGGPSRWLLAPVVHPLFAALDLAQDRARGVEVLEDWTPPPPFHRVW